MDDRLKEKLAVLNVRNVDMSLLELKQALASDEAYQKLKANNNIIRISLGLAAAHALAEATLVGCIADGTYKELKTKHNGKRKRNPNRWR